LPTVRTIHAKGLLYHFLQKDLREQDIWLFQMLAARLISTLGIWMHPDVYERLPVLVPYAVRDPLVRGNKAKGMPDNWGAPNDAGYFRDDNSLVKGLPRTLAIDGPTRGPYRGARIGTGFVAAHVWRTLSGNAGLSARNATTYSFVPNLVWLPGEIAALTDREGSFAQLYVQALAQKVYRHRTVAPPLIPVVEHAWSLLPPPVGVPEQGLPDVEELNFFVPTDSWRNERIQKIRLVADALEGVRAGESLPGKVISGRYGGGLSDISPRAAAALRDKLRLFL